MNKATSVYLVFIMFCFHIGYGQIQLGETLDVIDNDFAYANSVSTSFDGRRVAVAGYGKSEFGFRVYDYNGSNWHQVGADIQTEHPDEVTGYKVALSADGNRLVTSTIKFRTGFVRVYELVNNNWIQLGSTLYGESSLDIYGLVIAISSDGQRITSSAKFNNGSTGHARVYEYNGNEWIQLGSDIDGDASGNYFSTSLSLSGDGNRVAVGANQYYPNGLMRIFEFDGTDWIQLGTDLTGIESYDNFGVSANLSYEGNRIIVGDNQTNAYTGYAKVFDFDGDDWVQVGDALQGENIRDKFGLAVTISDEGNRVAVGAPSQDDILNTELPGYVKVYELIDDNWVHIGIALYGEDVGGQFGSWLNISGDGSVLITGALNFTYKQSGTEVGYAKVYDLNTLLSLSDNTSSHKAIIIYPNPSSKYVYFSNSEFINEIKLFNSIGQKIEIDRGTTNKIDISGLSNGVYHIQFLLDKNQIVNQKILKN
ncbi:T9SS type A sorting domain-containing protein [Planktosalinus lacus]|nr:T9SS type A sorting domain-containing protein [Planktosalinus lacus]